MKRFLAGAVWTLALAFGLASHSALAQEEKYITLASTTSTENSGLFGHILPLFTQASGIEVRVVARGTGQALQMARKEPFNPAKAVTSNQVLAIEE